jgi:hypothetical protein
MGGLGLADGTNCLAWDTADDLVDLLRLWTGPERSADRLAIRRHAAELARDRFGWDTTVEELLAIVRDYRARKGPP